jgi:prephenate dehydrogenase
VRVAVLGLGLIGGSAALALKARGYDRDAAARAREHGGLALELALAQPEALAAAIDTIRRELDEFSRPLAGRRVDKLRPWFEQATRSRRGLEPGVLKIED